MKGPSGVRLRDMVATLIVVAVVLVQMERNSPGSELLTRDDVRESSNLTDYLTLLEGEARSALIERGPDILIPIVEPPVRVFAAVAALGVSPHRVTVLYDEDIVGNPFHYVVALPYGASQSLDTFLVEIGLTKDEKHRASELSCIHLAASSP